KHKQSLRSYLKEQLDSQWLVKAYALLRYNNIFGYDTAMALALIPLGTRDEEVFRILYGLPKEGRKELEKSYNETFGDASHGGTAEYIDTGSLKGHLKG